MTVQTGRLYASCVFADQPSKKKKDLVGRNRMTKAGFAHLSTKTIKTVVLAGSWIQEKILPKFDPDLFDN